MTPIERDRLARLAGLTPALAAYLPRQRWASQARRIESIVVEDAAVLPALGERYPLTFIGVRYQGGGHDLCWLPLAPADDGAGNIGTPIGRIETGDGPLTVADAFASPRCCAALAQAMAAAASIPTERGGVITFAGTDALRATLPPATTVEQALAALPPRRIGAEQSNTSVVYGDRFIAKAFRRLAAGPNPDLEVTRFLSSPVRAGAPPRFLHVPPVVGWAELTRPEQPAEPISLLVAQAFVANQGDGWSYTLDTLRTFITRVAPHGGQDRDLTALERAVVEVGFTFLMDAARLGAITAELHLALASEPDQPDFRPEPTTRADVDAWAAAIARQADQVLDALQQADQPKRVRGAIGRVLADRQQVAGVGRDLAVLAEQAVMKTRFHGDYHLGQVLKTDTGFVVLDFEGEPLRPIAERRAKASPLKDVAGMLRSFNYARHAVVRELSGRLAIEPARIDGLGEAWERATRRIFLDAYLSTAKPGAASFLPRTRSLVDQVIRVYELEKAVYELNYELHHRPDWLPIPLAFVAGVLTGYPRRG